MQVLLLVLFVAYLYVPYLLFKFFVEESFDLIRRRDHTRVEEFFAAALPSALLNGATWLLLTCLGWTRYRFGIGVNFPSVEWKAVAGLLDPQLVAVRSHLALGLRSEATYLFVLFGLSAVFGKIYGVIELRLFERGAVREFFAQRRHVRNHWR